MAIRPIGGVQVNPVPPRMFGFQANPYTGILDERTNRMANAQALLSLGAGLLSQGGWQPRPTSLGQAFGAAVPPALQAHQGYLQNAMAAQMGGLQLEEAQRLRQQREGWADRVKAMGLEPGITQVLTELGYDEGAPLLEKYQIAAMKPQDRWRTLSPDEAEGRGFKPGQVVQVNMRTGAYKTPGSPLVDMGEINEFEARQATIDRYRAQFEQTGDPKFEQLANALEMQQIFPGGKAPQGYIDARTSIGQARKGIADTYTLIAEGTGPFSPTDRRKLSQSYKAAFSAFAKLSGAGANFTESEQRFINQILGGDPTDIFARILRGDQDFMAGLQQAGEIIELRGQELLDAYTNPRLPEFTPPWATTEADTPAPPAPAETTEAGLSGAGQAEAARLREMTDQEILDELRAKGLIQ